MTAWNGSTCDNAPLEAACDCGFRGIFEALSYAHLRTAQTLHREALSRVRDMEGKVYLFFDEIQEVAQWKKAVNSFRAELERDIYITGSNARLLSGELATALGGRYVAFTTRTSPSPIP